MSMQQLIYASRPFGYDSSILANILSVARLRNAQNDITGALICRQDIYLQLLEGPEGQVESTFDKISEDDRHIELTLLVRCHVEDRLFPQWAMKHDPARSWMWSPKEIQEGVQFRASAQAVRSIFLRSTDPTEL
ncbi:BLUF domain-containing protein [Roseobacter weihaiensis]|uniref:BLUF domain-containing protein n=1 Tax=Roseobacter weihaiensis TaxID=2763262 RepID=UPI001D0A3687|nr:BLUF domain-containing protein [Roseobacter sp. H9]